ncbi:MAG: DinB family protein [Terriglobia bacterium]
MASQDRALRDHLLGLLEGRNAHVAFEDAVAGIPAKVRGRTPAGAAHSPWQIIEHLRLAQWDILEFSRNSKHASPEWPAGYWPATEAPPRRTSWNESIASFQADLRAMKKIAARSDLYARIPHGQGQTLLREVLVLADHNAYHLGELVVVRRLLGAWKKS